MKNKPNARKRRTTRRIAKLLLCVCLLVAIVMGALGAMELLERKKGEAYYSQIASNALGSPIGTTADSTATSRMATDATATDSTAPARIAAGSTIPAQQSEAATVNTPSRQSAMDFGRLYAISPDVVGWIRCEGTLIDYPIVQGTDNDYYLSHLPDGTKNAAGSIMMDYVCDAQFQDDITILHGHHMKNGSMFGDLNEFRDAAYYAAHPTMQLYTPDGDYRVEIFAAIIVNGVQFPYTTTFATEADFEQFKQWAMDESAIDTDVQIASTDQLLLLSTCDYTYRHARFLVIGKLVADDLSPTH